MGKALFITGTGTDVGKTALSLASLQWARKRGLRAAYHKPIQCGAFTFGQPPRQGGDADWIRMMTGQEGAASASAASSTASLASTHAASASAPPATRESYRLLLPASPHLAAEREGVVIDLGRVRADLESLLAENDFVVVEGSGGAAVPVNRQGMTLAHLAAEMSLPCLIACAPGLGTLHHTRTTVAYLKTLQASIAGFAFCQREPERNPSPAAPSTTGTSPNWSAASTGAAAVAQYSGASEDLSHDNQRTLEALTGLPFFGTLPFSRQASEGIPMSASEAEAWRAPLDPALDRWWKSA